MTENDRLVTLADLEGWPWIIEDDENSDVIIKDGDRYVYWRHVRGKIDYASDNLGPLGKPIVKTLESAILSRLRPLVGSVESSEDNAE